MKKNIFFSILISTNLFAPFYLSSCSKQDTWTIMVYLCGSDLESNSENGGWATNQVEKMLSSNFGENTRILMETGGSTTWKKYGISNQNLQYYEIKNHELLLCETLENNDISNPNSLKNFLNWSINKYHSDKYALFFFDHGFAWQGCELDENSSNILSPLQIKNVLKEVYENSLNQQKLELINFDNCLMANVENICAISPYTKNIIANEEKGFFKKELPLTTGFDYASIFEYISKFSTTKSEIIGKYIVDRYANFQSQANLRYVTSSIETKKIGKLNEELENFFLGSSDSNIDLWKQTARDSEKFDNNTIDLYNWLEHLPNDSQARKVIDVLNEINVYLKVSNNLYEHAHGVNIYFPLTDVITPQENGYNQIIEYDEIYSTAENDFFAKTWNDILTLNWYV